MTDQVTQPNSSAKSGQHLDVGALCTKEVSFEVSRSTHYMFITMAIRDEEIIITPHCISSCV